MLRLAQRPRRGNDRGGLIRTIRHIEPWPKKATEESVQDMESSRRYLLQAEVEYWHEMLRINRNRLTKLQEKQMRDCLKAALRSLNSRATTSYRAAA